MMTGIGAPQSPAGIAPQRDNVQSDEAGGCQRRWVAGGTKLTGRGALWLVKGFAQKSKTSGDIEFFSAVVCVSLRSLR
jgi:hypothetical protein